MATVAMTTSGCLAVAGAVAALSVGLAEEGWAQSGQSCYATSSGSLTKQGNAIYNDSVQNYGALCGSTNGTHGVCMASINAALQCAIGHFNGPSGLNDGTITDSYILTVGDGTTSNPLTIDLTRDTSLSGPGAWMPTAPAFVFAQEVAGNQVDGLQPAPNFSGSTVGTLGTTCDNGSGCLTITGADGDSSATTIVTPAGFEAFKGNGVNHLVLEHLTMRQPAETMVEGFYVPPYTSTKVTAPGGQYGYFAAMQFQQTNASTALVQNPNAFASVADGGSGYSCTGRGTKCLVSVVLPPPPVTPPSQGCSSGATLQVNVDSSAGAVYGVQSILAPPSGCPQGYQYPTSSDPVVSSLLSGGTVSANASFYVAYTPSPMTVYNQVANEFNNPGPFETAFGSVKAFTNTVPPRKIVSISPTQNTERFVPNGEGPPPGILIAPVYNSSPSQYWTLTMFNHLKNGHDAWIDTYPAGISPAPLLCLDSDGGKGLTFQDQDSNGNPLGADVSLKDMVWINAGRNLLEGIIGVRITNNSFVRGSDALSQTQCHAVSGGGFQIGQPNDQAIWGETVKYLISAGTEDDTVAIFNDNGTGNNDGISSDGSLTYPKSYIGGNLVDSDYRYVNVVNNSLVTGLANSTSETTTSCGYTYTSNPPTNGTLSGPDVSAITAVRCDPCMVYCYISNNGSSTSSVSWNGTN